MVQNGRTDAQGGRVLRSAIRALEARGEAPLHRSRTEIDAQAARLGIRLPTGLTALLEHFGNGCSGRGGGQTVLSPEELGYLAALDGVDEPVAVAPGTKVSPADVVAFTDEELDGSVWCLLADGHDPAAVGRFVPRWESPAIVDLMSSFDAWLELLADVDGELVSHRTSSRADDGDRTRTISLEG